ncbi:MAG: hypothetical protein ACYS26_13250 [Planctomycetota bacterium]|jgi:hypothetical protein
MQPTSPYDDNHDADPYQEPVNRPADGARMGGPEALGGDFQGGSDAQDFMNLAGDDDASAPSGDGLDLAPRGDFAERVDDAPAPQPMAAQEGHAASGDADAGELSLDGYDVADQPEVQVDASLEDSIEIEADGEGSGSDVFEEHFGELEFAETEEEPAQGSGSKSIVMVGFVAGVGIASTMAIVGKGDADLDAPAPQPRVQQQVAQAPEAGTEYDEIELGVHAFAGYQPQFEPAGEGLGGAFANAFGEMLTTEVDPDLAAAEQSAPMMGEPAPGSAEELANAPAPVPTQPTFETNGVEVAVSFGEPAQGDVTGSAALPAEEFYAESSEEFAPTESELSDSEFGMALPDNLDDRERAALLSATRYVEDSRESRRISLSFEDQLGAAGKVRVRMASADAFEHIWNFEVLPPLEAAHSEHEMLTPKVGGVRVILNDGELFEGALYSLGAGRAVLQTEVGRLILEAAQIDNVVQLHPMDEPELNAREVAMGDRVRVATAGGFLVGRVLKQDDDQLVLVLDSGARISLDSDSEISHLPENRTGAFLRLVKGEH